MAYKPNHPLNTRQRAFVDEYLLDLDGTAAARRVGFAPRSAKQTATKLMKLPQVQDAIAVAQAERAERLRIKADEVLTELAHLVRSDVRNLFHPDGALKRPHELDDATARSVASVKVVTTAKGEGAVEHVAEIKFWDKNKAIESAARHLGMFKDRVELTGKDGGAIQVEDVRSRIASRIARLAPGAAPSGGSGGPVG